MRNTYTFRLFFGVKPNLFANPLIILLVFPGVSGTGGTGGISSSISTSITYISSLFDDFKLLLLLKESARDRTDSLDFLLFQKLTSSLSTGLSSEELLHLDAGM